MSISNWGTVVGTRCVRLARWLVAGCALLVCAASSRAQNGATVATFELAAPIATEFILRGTIPVPPGTFPRADGLVPFKVRNYDGTTSAAHVERVSSYPNETMGADVVEVISRVRRDPAVGVGNFVRFDVVQEPHEWRRPRLTASVGALRDQPWGIEMRTHDVFGNLYRVDLRRGELGRKQLKLGRELQEMRYHGALKPVVPGTGPTAPLPHMMGVHAYMSYWSMENVITVDLRVHNAMSGLDKDPAVTDDDAQKKMYFDALELRVPAGWTILQDFTDPFLGLPQTVGNRTALQLVKPNPDGTFHVMGQQAQMERRIAICPIGNEERAREFLDTAYLGYCRSGTNAQGQALWSWWNPATSRYYPQRHALPQLPNLTHASIRAKLQNDLDHIQDAMISGISHGTYPIHSTVLGWAHPWGVAYGGMTSGSEIFLFDGFPTAIAASRDGYRYTSLRHRMYTDRMPTALFNLDGEPTNMHQWVRNNGSFDYVPALFFQTLLSGYDMFGFDVAPSHHVTYATANGLVPDYESELLAYMPIDLQHLGRYMNSPKTLAWLGNDSMAKDDIRMQAEIARLSYHDMPTSSSGSVIVSGMLAHINFVNLHPRVGFNFGRGQGWTVDSMCAAYSFADSAWRAEARPWFDKIVWLVGQGQALCTGVIQATISTKMLNAQHRARQSIEQAIVENALWSMRESVYVNVDPGRLADLEGTLVRSLYSMINFPGWNTSQNAPRSIAAVGPLDIQQPLYCSSFPSGATDGVVDRYQTPSSFAYGWYLTGDTLFLERAIDMQNPNYSDLYTAMHSGGLGSNLENKCASIALSEIANYP